MPSKHQIVMIMTDTTRFDMVGCYGFPAMKTPNIDSLASEGVRYEKTYTCQPVCEPARSAMFTGLYPHSNGGITNTVPLLQGVKTIGEYLTPMGIHSAYVGKWHLDGGDYFGNGVCPAGYDPDYWFDMRRYLDGMTSEERLRSRKEATSLSGVKAESTYAHQVSDRALSFLEKAADEDFFLAVSYDEPHQPFICPEPFASLYKDYEVPLTPDYDDTLEGKPLLERLWAGANRKADRKNLHIRPQLFLGCNSFVDWEIGRVLEAVKKHAPDAMVVFTSDHGEALLSHGLTAKGPSVYEAIAHIPLIIKGGSYAPSLKGVAYPSVTSHIDLVPTFLDYYGLDKSPERPGVSMLPTLSDTTKRLHDMVFVEFHRYEIDHDGFGGLQFMRAAVSDDHKLAIHLLDPVDELYDTKNDPYELKNVINDPAQRETRDKMHQAILKMMNDTRDPYRGYQWKCRPWNSFTPEWDVDGYTRQRPSAKGELVQLDYDTGLEITENVRKKVKAKKPAGQT